MVFWRVPDRANRHCLLTTKLMRRAGSSWLRSLLLITTSQCDPVFSRSAILYERVHVTCSVHGR
jgi:hypothetical protein